MNNILPDFADQTVNLLLRKPQKKELLKVVLVFGKNRGQTKDFHY